MWVCKCRRNKPRPRQPTTTSLTWGIKKQANRSPAQAKVTAAAKWGWQHVPPACTHTTEDSCPHGVNHKLLPRRKNPGSSRWLHQEDGLAKCYYQCQTSRSFPHTCSICHHSHSCSLSLPIVTHIHHSLSHSIKVTPVLTSSLVCFLCHRFLRFSKSRGICQGHILPQSVTMSPRGRQMLHIKLLLCTTLQKCKETVPVWKLS